LKANPCELNISKFSSVQDFSPKFVDSVMGNGGNIHALVYGICHIMGLGNACINPFLYGFLNENFRKEYQHIFQVQEKCL